MAIGWREKCTLTSLFLVLVAWGLGIFDVWNAILVEPKIKALTLKPVSYTHLDVYKRQELGSSARAFRISVSASGKFQKNHISSEANEMGASGF